jgi:hypothetical protein
VDDVNPSAVATVVPSLELFALQGRTTNIRANHNGARVGGDGNPLAADGERILHRWGGYANLVVTMNDDGFGPRGGDDGAYPLVPVAEGTLTLAVAEARLVGSFTKGDSIFGGLDAEKRRRVLTFSWPYVDVQSVAIERKPKAVGAGDKIAGVSVGSFEPPALLTLVSALPLNDSWTSAWIPRSDPESMAQSVAKAAARHRMAIGETGRWLADVLAGRWMTDANEQVAMLVDPDGDSRAAARSADQQSRRERADLLLLASDE